ncbi:hypothetical protein H5410_000907 [Solanum commersonii]|uniref:Uncharacterized protein n=1 Tax=Solanum commersonii TaxID=4109 RepID=A0A9J6AXD8_SOLCO|nr:hypothetical protein H5410_000907 [Solanum commersonii]
MKTTELIEYFLRDNAIYNDLVNDTSMVEFGGDERSISAVILAENHSVEALCVLDTNSDYVIGNYTHKFVQVKQLYKDKNTIVVVMQKYAVENHIHVL